MEGTQISEMLRALERLNLAELSEKELASLQERLMNWQEKMTSVLTEVTWARAERWWQQMPREDMRTIRLLLKNTRLTAPLLQSTPELSHLLLLADVENPDVVRLWANMTPDVRAKRIDELRYAVSLTEHRRTTTSREDKTESYLLAYDVLGLTSTASWADVRKAYRDLAALHHPDQGGDPRLFKVIQKAYQQLESRYL